MEDLRFIPLLMFFSGVLLVYSGFTNDTPLGVIRRFLGQDTSTDPSSGPYTAINDPFYAGINTSGGVRTYQAPPRSGNPGFYS